MISTDRITVVVSIVIPIQEKNKERKNNTKKLVLFFNARQQTKYVLFLLNHQSLLID